MRPIGIVRSALKDPADAPKTAGALTGQEFVDPLFLPALDGIDRKRGKIMP